jgi:prepilin-type N-terminal cleavage/methylation domain-containing protein
MTNIRRIAQKLDLDSLRRQEGVTLVELLVTMLILLVVTGAIYGLWGRLAGAYLFTEDDMRAQAEARMALGELVEYVRTARVPETVANEALDTPIPKAGPFEIWLWTDVDRDPAHDLELVRFMATRSGGTTYLIRQESLSADGVWDGAPVRVVNQNVRNGGPGSTLDPSIDPIFVYADANGVPLTGAFDVTTIRTVGIDLRIDIDVDRAPIIHQLASVVQPRNLRQY